MSNVVQVYSRDYDDAVKVEVVCTYKCNYNCPYCFNMKLIEQRTSQELDLKKVFDFALSINSRTGKHVLLSLIGGEPTLHSQLLWLCNSAKDSHGAIEVVLFTNFSKDVDFFKQVLQSGAKLLITYHHTTKARQAEFFAKLNAIKTSNLDGGIDTINVMLLQDSFDDCLQVYDFLYSLYGNKVRCNLIDDCDKDCMAYNRQKNYSSDQISAYLERCNRSQLADDNVVVYDDGRSIEVNDYQIKNSSDINFNKWVCNAGRDYFSVAIDGSIYPCSMMKQKKLGSIYDMSTLKIGKTLCMTSSCPCEYGIPKKKVFG